MKKLFTSLVISMMVATTAMSSYDWGVSEDYTLLNMIEESDIAVIGTVAVMTGVYRQDFWFPGHNAITTDVVINVETMIKGEPNLGDTNVIFTIVGGTAYIAGEGVMEYKVTNDIEFEVGERVMLFLSTRLPENYEGNQPYDGLHLMQAYYGKRLIKDSMIRVWYKKDDDNLTTMKLSLDLAKTLGQAFMVDKDATRLLENQIKAIAKNPPATRTLSSALTNQLKASAQQIIDDAKEDSDE